jgi:hypothetical protein
MMNAMKQNQWESGHQVVNLANKTAKPQNPAKSTRLKTSNLSGK